LAHAQRVQRAQQARHAWLVPVSMKAARPFVNHQVGGVERGRWKPVSTA
jgi:hypothetical protein